MLGKLVNKFKKHSLQEETITTRNTDDNGSYESIHPENNHAGSGSGSGIGPTITVVAQQSQQLNRRSARLNAFYQVFFYYNSNSFFFEYVLGFS